MDPDHGIAQVEHEGACPWCQRTLRCQTGARAVVCGCGSVSVVALLKPPQVALARRPRKPRRSRRAARMEARGAWLLLEMATGLLGFLLDLF